MATSTFLKSRVLVLGGGTLLVGATLWWALAPRPAEPVAASVAPRPAQVASSPGVKNYPHTPELTRVVAAPAASAAAHSTAKPPVAPARSYVDAPVVPLATALDLRAEVGLPARVAALHATGCNLSRPDWEKLRAFLLQPETPTSLNPSQLRYLKNEVMNALALGETWRAEQVVCMQTVNLDPKQDPAIRDYALQFIGAAVEQEPGLGWGFHLSVAEGENKDLAATAILHLLRATQLGQLTEVDQARLSAAALQIVNNPALPATNRATALSVCGGLGLQAARPVARQLSESDATPLVARIAAIATLGDLGGDAATRDTLQKLTTASDTRLHLPATAALARYRLSEG